MTRTKSANGVYRLRCLSIDHSTFIDNATRSKAPWMNKLRAFVLIIEVTTSAHLYDSEGSTYRYIAENVSDGILVSQMPAISLAIAHEDPAYRGSGTNYIDQQALPLARLILDALKIQEARRRVTLLSRRASHAKKIKIKGYIEA